MPKFLRHVRKGRWYPPEEPFDWLPQDERPADPLGDLSTRECALSVWELTDDGSNRERVLAAIASTRMTLAQVDYIVFSSEVLDGLGLTVVKSEGDTHDDKANALWHYDIRRLSDARLVSLGRRLLQLVTEEDDCLSRIQPFRLKPLLVDGIRSGRLADGIDARLREDLGLQ
jgi:hypothetical protein